MRKGEKMTRRHMVLSFLINILIYLIVVLTLSYLPLFARSGSSFIIVPIAPLLLACGIVLSNNLSEIILSSVSIIITINAIAMVALSIAKLKRKIFFILAHLGITLYWLFSLIFLYFFK